MICKRKRQSYKRNLVYISLFNLWLHMVAKIEGIYYIIIASFKYTKAEMLIKPPKIWNMVPEVASVHILKYSNKIF